MFFCLLKFSSKLSNIIQLSFWTNTIPFKLAWNNSRRKPSKQTTIKPQNIKYRNKNRRIKQKVYSFKRTNKKFENSKFWFT